MLKIGRLRQLKPLCERAVAAFSTTTPCMKKRKTREEKKMPRTIVHNAKSKWKSTDVVQVWRGMTLRELAEALGKDVDHVLEAMTFIDDTAHYRKADQVVDNFNVIQEVVKKSGKRWQMMKKEQPLEETFVEPKRRDPSEYVNSKPRPPVVAIMGHVDHGKTTLLDSLRDSRIVDGEFGGITQHIGAFVVRLGKEVVTFLDTPGHAAFCSMRSRGAQATDIVVLVVAADDGVMEQTVESISMARNAEVPIIVALNKMDKPKADPERAKRELVQHGLQVEEFGGDVQVVPVSALNGTNLDALVEAILVQAELMALSSDYSGPVEGVVIECSTDPHRGKLCTVLVQCGTLRKGVVLVAGKAWCKIRAMFDERGEPVQEAPPSTPVQTIGWRALPSAGDLALQVETEKRADQIASKRLELEQFEKSKQDYTIIEQKAQEHYKQYRERLEQKRKMGRFRLKPDGPRKKEFEDDKSLKVNIVVKADVDGSVEAILDVLDTYESNMCKLNVVHYGVGPVSKNDIILAELFNAIVYAFNTKELEDAKGNVKIKHHNVIYKLVEDVKGEINSVLPEKEVEEVLGEASVLQEFTINEGKAKVPVAGCRCQKGIVKKSAFVKLLRDGECIYTGKIASLRHHKDEVDSVKKDLECGLRIEDVSIKFKPGDTIVCFQINQIPRTIDWDPGF
ncbi:translation initiation factor IF-2, mitochondrial [Cimex lectularius]|uniref:Translation initiation factor IF-2, mitochondrial n=1 Tax=Cimex lectularius TaxID=79782 RepID=A0A8I6RDB3_CIMLE|nr:translation initiation factor IF-2, mitochondrial [Cimex lectularius]